MHKKPRKKDNVVYLKRGDHIHKLDTAPKRFALSAPMVITVLLIFFGALSSVIAAAHMTDMRGEVAAARRERDAQLDANRVLAGQMPTPFTLDEIEEIAQERLGMARPDPSQIFYIYVPPISHVVFNPDAAILPQERSFWGDMRIFITDIINRVFGGG